MSCPVRARLFVTQMRRGRLHARSCRHVRVDGPYRPSGRNASPSGITPPTIMSPTQGSPGSSTEIRLSTRARTTRTSRITNHAHGPPNTSRSPIRPNEPQSLRRVPCTDKELGRAPTEKCPPGVRFIGSFEKGTNMMVTIGVDPHKQTHTGVAVDQLGVQIAQRTAAARREGFGQLLEWGSQARRRAGLGDRGRSARLRGG